MTKKTSSFLSIKREIEEHLLSSEKMADIGKRIGAYDLIKSQVLVNIFT